MPSIPGPLWPGQPSLPPTPPAILRVRTYRRRVCVTYESWSRCQCREFLYVDTTIGDADAVIIAKAANNFRKLHGYSDRLVSVDIHPQEA